MRHEYKHIINYGDYLALKSRLNIIMNKDEHSIDGKYKIRSIYFDDLDDQAYQDKINGLSNRSKYRLRYYNDDACINVKNADKVFINVKNDNYLVANISDETYDGAIYSKDDLTINGYGSLNINSNIHCIVSNDSLTIMDTIIDINAVKDGIHVNDSIEISNASLNIISDDGMTCDNTDSYIYIESGNIVINCDDDAIKSENEIIVDGGSINIINCYEGIEALNITINDGKS